jgi:hypothetical protein
VFAGHIGAGLALARQEPRLNPAAFVLAAMLLDAVLWTLVLAGVESVAIPADFPAHHQPEFRFPCSHGVAGAFALSAAAAGATWLLAARLGRARGRAAGLAGLAVFSHWLLDALVHAPELPLLGSGSLLIGLGLWRQMPVALAVEAALALGGAWYWMRASSAPRGHRIVLFLLVAFALVATIYGMTSAPPPPSAAAMAATSLATIALVAGLFAWLGRARTGSEA